MKIFCNEQLSPKNQQIFGNVRNLWRNYFVRISEEKVDCSEILTLNTTEEVNEQLKGIEDLVKRNEQMGQKRTLDERNSNNVESNEAKKKKNKDLIKYGFGFPAGTTPRR